MVDDHERDEFLLGPTETQREEPDSMPKKSKQSTHCPGFLTFSCIAAVTGSTMMWGYGCTVLNQPFYAIQTFINQSSIDTYNEPLTDADIQLRWGLASSLLSIGGFLGSCYFPGWEARRVGRARSMFYNAPVGVIGAFFSFLSLYADNYVLLLIGRAVTGIHVGVNVVISSALIAEIAPVGDRGFFGSINELALQFGGLTAAILSIPKILGSQYLWGCLFLIPMALIIFHWISMAFAAESPRWLVDQNRFDDAWNTLKRLRSHESDDDIQVEFEAIKEVSKEEASMAKVGLLDFFKSRQLWWPLIICIVLHTQHQLSGVDCITFYSSQVLATAGMDQREADISFLAIIAAGFVCNCISMFFFDRFGRRTMLLIGLSGLLLSNIITTLALNFDWPPYVIMASFIFFNVSYSLGPGPIPFFLAAELFVQNARPVALGVAIAANWLSGGVTTLLFPSFQFYFPTLAFVPFACYSSLAILFFALFLPETSGIPSEKITLWFAPGQSLLMFQRQPSVMKERDNANYKTFDTNGDNYEIDQWNKIAIAESG